MSALSTRRPRGRSSSVRSRTAVDTSLLTQRLAWLAYAAAWLFVALSAISFNVGDPPSGLVSPANDPVVNWCGRVGAMIAYFGYELFGWALWALIALWCTHLYLMAAGRKVGHFWVRALGALMMGASLAGMQALIMPSAGPIQRLSGGLIGSVGASELYQRFNGVGTFMCLALLFIVGAVVCLDAWALVAAMWAGRAVVNVGKPVGRFALTAASAGAGRIAGAMAEREDSRSRSRTGASPRLNDVDDDENVPGREEAKRPRKARVGEPPEAPEPEDESDDDVKPVAPAPAAPVADAPSEAVADSESTEEAGDEDAAGAPQVFDPEQLRAKIAKLPLRFAATGKRSATEEDLRDIQNVQDMEGYRFPGLDLLEEPEQNYSEKLEAFVREQAEILERALKEYRIDGHVVGIESGPVITNYEVRLAPGTKVAQLGAISSDLARNLKAVNIRVVPNTAGRDTVGIEVPNAIKEKVRLKELMTKSEAASKMSLPMFLGKDASGEPLIVDLAACPHLLIAGTTGSGKSVCMNTVIMSFLYTKKPNELKLVLVDPKMVEMSQFKDIPHLMCPVVTEMGKAAAILEWAVGKMEERYELLAEAGCRDIASYNALTWEELKDAFQPTSPEEEARIPRKLPFMVFVIDELADLMMTNREVEHAIVRIAQKARAVGIHLIIATQRPQANVVTGLIKSNMPARMCFKVASGMDSRIVMDQKGGELLLGQGDSLFLSPRSSKLTRAQGTLVDDREIRKVVKFMREVATPTFERQLIQLRPSGGGEEGAVGGDVAEGERNGWHNAQEDPLFDQAVEIVLETKRGSVSMLQRRMAVGYTRAARLIEMMGEAGILGGHKGTVAREVVMTLDEWRALKAQAQADADNEARNAKQGELFNGAPAGAKPEIVVTAAADAERVRSYTDSSMEDPAGFDADPDNLDGDKPDERPF